MPLLDSLSLIVNHNIYLIVHNNNKVSILKMESAFDKAKNQFNFFINNKESFNDFCRMMKPNPIIECLLCNDIFKKEFKKVIVSNLYYLNILFHFKHLLLSNHF